MGMKMVVGTAVAVCMLVALGSSAGAADDDGLREANSIVYEVDDGRVTVTQTITLTNELRDQRRGNVITQFYFEAYGIPIPSEAVNLRVEGATITADVVQPFAGTRVIEMSMGRLFRNNTRTITVTYQLDTGAIRSSSPYRINPAYIAFPVWGVADTGLLDIRVEFPDHMEVAQFESEMRWLPGEGRTETLQVSGVDPEEFFSYVTLRDDSQLNDTELEVDGARFLIRSWPLDFEWRRHVIDVLRRQLPVMIDTIGAEWPEDRVIEITQASVNYLYGYGGFYDSIDGLIEIGEDLDEHLLLHELSHVWVNRDVLSDRWLIEGLAEELAAQTLERSGSTDQKPPFVRRDDRDSQNLLLWPHPRFFGEEDIDRAEWAYNASWGVIGRVAEEIGPDNFTKLVAALLTEDLPYRNLDGTAETGLSNSDWRRFLDLAEETGGATVAQDELLEWILPDRASYGESLDSRDEAREAYAGLIDELDGWPLPDRLQSSMSRWRFSEALDTIAEAESVLAERQDLATKAESMGLVSPEAEGELFRDNDDLTPISDAFERRAGALDTIVEIESLATAERDWRTRLGLWREVDPIEEIDKARAAFEDDDTDEVAAARQRLADRLDSAAENGELRAYRAGGAAVGGLLLLILFGVFIRQIRRRRRARREAEASALSAAVPVGDGDASPDQALEPTEALVPAGTPSVDVTPSAERSSPLGLTPSSEAAPPPDHPDQA